MTLFVFILVLSSAALHALWNALLRSSEERFWTVMVMGLTSGLMTIPFLFFMPLPEVAGWPYLLASVILHIGYSMFLINAYRHGDLSQVYPIARGTSPLLITLGGMLFAHEHLTALSIVGVVLVSAGIISLAHPKNGSSRLSVFTAMGTGFFIAAYSVVDALGARLSTHPVSYSMWLFMLYGVAMTTVYFFRDGLPKIKLSQPKTRQAILSGALSTIAYTIVIWAMTLGPMGPVSALRETSVVFAALIGRFFLHERLTFRRLAACVVIVGGTVCLG